MADIPGDPEQELGDPVEIARLICLRQLEVRARSRAELATTLAKRGVPIEASEEVLDRFTDVGLIDDAVFAQEWVRQRSRTKAMSRAALRQELTRKGIAADTASGAIAELDPDAEVKAARALVLRKLGGMRSLDQQAQMRRLIGMLARRGYGHGVAFAVVAGVLEDVAGAPDG